MPFLYVLLTLLASLSFSDSSVGDQSPEFRYCVNDCLVLPGVHGLAQQLMGWSHLAECQYQCMHQVTATDIQHNRPVRQFFGKWPFVRLCGIQEPASFLFSVLNGVGVVIGYVRFCGRAPTTYPYHQVIFLQFLINLNAWVWSTVFHSRDLLWTEKMDYFSAAAFIVVGLVVQFVRLSGKAMKWQIAYSMLWCLLFGCHVTYLSYFKFDYGYNMAACVLCGLVYSVVWVVWCVKNAKRVYVWKCATTVLLTSCLVSLELFDFPPLWWTLDAHSLWHLSTIPLPLLWYSFLTDDAVYEAKKNKKD